MKIKTEALKKNCIKRLIEGLKNPISTFTGNERIISSYELESQDVEDLLLLLNEHDISEKKYKKTKKKEKIPNPLCQCKFCLRY